MSKLKAKKTSTIKHTSILTPPKGFDSKKYAGRWVAESRLNMRSDGYEPRGYSAWKDSTGNTIRVGDLVWCYKSKEDALLEKREKFDAAYDQIVSVGERAVENDARLKFELEQAGGEMEVEIKHE